MTTASYKKFVDIAAVTIAAVGVPLFFWGEYQEVRRERVNRVLQYAEEYGRGEVYEVRQKLFEVWSEFPVGELSDLRASPVVWDKLVYDLAQTNGDFRDGIIELIAFFDTVGNCVAVRECDRSTSRELILKQALTFCEMYGRVVMRIRTQSALSSFGDGLQELISLGPGDEQCTLESN